MLVFPTSQGFESNLTISSNESIIVDCSQLNDISHEFIDSMIRYSSNISEFRVSGSKLNENCIDSLFEYLFPSLRFILFIYLLIYCNNNILKSLDLWNDLIFHIHHFHLNHNIFYVK